MLEYSIRGKIYALHRHYTNRFTVCYLQEGKPEYIQTFRLKDLNNFIRNLQETDEIALEATGNSYFFYDTLR